MRKKTDCEKCKNRSACKAPCPAVERELAKVTGPDHESLPPDFVAQAKDPNVRWPEGSKSRLTSPQKKIFIFFLRFEKQMKPIEIAQLIHCSESQVYRILSTFQHRE